MIYTVLLLVLIVILWHTRRSLGHFLIRLVPWMLIYTLGFLAVAAPTVVFTDFLEKKDQRETARQNYIDEHGIDPCEDTNTSDEQLVPGVSAETIVQFDDIEQMNKYLAERRDHREKYC